MPCGSILREALKFEVIAAIVLYDESAREEPAIRINEVDPGAKQTGEGLFWQFFQWINRGSFEVSADAFTTFRVGYSVYNPPLAVYFSKLFIHNMALGYPYET